MSRPDAVAAIAQRVADRRSRIAVLTGGGPVTGPVGGETTSAAGATGATGAVSGGAAAARAAASDGAPTTASAFASAMSEAGGTDPAAATTATASTAATAVAAADLDLSASGTATPTAGAWTIPWAPGTTPTQDTSPHGRQVATAAAVAAGRMLPEAQVATPTIITRAATSTATAAATAADPLAVTSPVHGHLSQDFGPTTSKYSAPDTVDGVYYKHFHDGIDLAAKLGSPVRAMAAGTVVFAGKYPDGAEVVRIQHADGSIALYAHMARGLDVRKGDKVAAGQQIGVVGMTGHTTGPHLHLELLVNGKDADPLPVLQAGRLPGAADGSIDTSVLPAAGTTATTATTAAFERFDKVADTIPYAAEIRAAAAKAGIDPLLLASLVKAESSFHPDSVSRCGAMGLCQLMPATAKALHVTDPFDPAQNLRAGAKYLANNLRLYGRVDVALAAYQAGKGAVAAAGGGIPDSSTTHHYINRILHSWAGYMEAAA